jgi:hypothetical protein
MPLATRCAATLGILAIIACHTTKVVRMDEGLASNRVWVTLQDQSIVELYGPKVYGNKLVGYVSGRYQEYPTAQVKEMRVRQPAGARTAALVVAGMVGFGGFVYALAGVAKSPKAPDYCDAPEHVDEPICSGL